MTDDKQYFHSCQQYKHAKRISEWDNSIIEMDEELVPDVSGDRSIIL